MHERNSQISFTICAELQSRTTCNIATHSLCWKVFNAYFPIDISELIVLVVCRKGGIGFFFNIFWGNYLDLPSPNVPIELTSLKSPLWHRAWFYFIYIKKDLLCCRFSDHILIVQAGGFYSADSVIALSFLQGEITFVWEAIPNLFQTSASGKSVIVGDSPCSFDRLAGGWKLI